MYTDEKGKTSHEKEENFLKSKEDIEICWRCDVN